MKDKDFDKIFSEKLKENYTFPLDEKDWENLEKRLDDSDSHKTALNRGNKKYWAWLIPLLLLLLLGNAWLLFKVNTSQMQNNDLAKELSELKSLLKNKETWTEPQQIRSTDTVYIYKTLYKERPFSTTDNSTSFMGQNSTPSVLTESKTTLTSNFSTENLKENKFDDISKTNISASLSTENTKNLSLNYLEHLKLPSSISNTKPEAKIIFIKNTPTIIPTAKNIHKNRLFVGINGGVINYHTQWFNRDNIEISKNEKSYQVGIKAEYSLHKNWRIVADANYCPYNFKIHWIDNRYNLPPLPKYYSPNKHTMNSIEGSQEMYLGSLGLKYLFEYQRIRPYLGISYATLRLDPYSCNYTYTDNTNWKTYSYESNLEKRVNIMNIALLQGGLEYRLSKHLLLQTEGYYYKDMNKTAKTFDLFGLRGSVLWGF